MACDGGLDAGDGFAHSGEQQRIVQMVEVGREEAAGGVGIAEMPRLSSTLAVTGWTAEFGGQIARGLRIG